MSKVNIKELIANMTVEEKIGQLIQLNASCFGQSSAEITGPLSNVGIPHDFLPYVGSALNFSSAEEMIELQKNHLAADRNKIPMIFMMDVIHGYRTIYPIPLAMGASFDTSVTEECCKMAARESVAGGIQVTFAPMVDYVRDPRWGRVMESGGEEPLLNGLIGKAQVKAFQGNGFDEPDTIAACVKHFAAYGGAESGKDYNLVELSQRLLRECYLPAYKDCIDAGVRLLMPSFNALNGIPSIANSWLMKKILKDEWGFDGIVISDYNAAGELIRHGIAQDKKDAAEKVFDNGCDIEMMSSSYCLHLGELISEGRFDMAQLDRAVEKILSLKEELGLFDDPYRTASPKREEELCLCAEHRDIARRAAEASAILLKNQGILPLSRDIRTIALIGPFATAHAINGFWSCNGKDTDTVSVEEGIKALLPNCRVLTAKGCEATYDNLSTEGFAEALDIAAKADAVVLCLGEPWNYSGEANCRADLGLPGAQNQLARAVTEVNKNTAALLFNGRPLVLTELDKCVPAILEMFFPGSEGGNAAANLLFGIVNPSGKVSMSFPKATGQCPIYYNRTRTGRPKRDAEDDKLQRYTSSYIDCGNLALYPFGHGLSYTSFEYEGMELDRTCITPNEALKVRITLKNSGDRAGKEVVQLYMYDVVASVVRPIQQLIAFEKISLEAGERKTVEFTVTEEMLRFYNFECEHISEAGEFILYTGHADNLLFPNTFNLDK